MIALALSLALQVLFCGEFGAASCYFGKHRCSPGAIACECRVVEKPRVHPDGTIGPFGFLKCVPMKTKENR